MSNAISTADRRARRPSRRKHGLNERLRAALALLLGTSLTWAAPMLGLMATGHEVAAYLHFPPRTESVSHAPFSWTAFALMSVPAVCAIGLFVAAALQPRPKTPAPRNTRGRFPWWGWLGVALVATGWTLAWTEGAVPPAWRRHTFTPIWLGYALVMNGLARLRGGSSPLVDCTGWFLALFPVSALFWWLFEYLNQFVDNWYYGGVAVGGDLDYFVQATLPFSTVLPAVASTIAWLKTSPRLEALSLPAMRGHAGLAWAASIAGVLGLAGVGTDPEILYPALWLAPPLVFVGLQHLLLGETLLSPIRDGDWRPLLQPALAGLVCGLFWELWNYGAAAKWHYSIPYVQRFHVFEMPLLGYAGYLPFGVECAVVMDLVGKLVGRRRAP